MKNKKSSKPTFILYINKTKRKKTDKICPLCGYTYSDFKEFGFLGCPECYKTFYHEIINYLKDIHNDIQYKGEIPKRFKKRKHD